MKKAFIANICLFLHLNLAAQDLEPIPLTDEWLSQIAAIAPTRPSVPTDGNKEVLIFSLHTGYEHWAIPHTEAVIRLLLSQSGAARYTSSRDIAVFERDALKQFHTVILNNTCPERDKRDIFYDIFRKNDRMSEEERLKKAAELETNLIRYVAEGGGLMLVHGGATMQNNSEDFSFMTGGSFDFHPPQQPIKVHLAEAGHPLLKAFNGQGFEYTDEPYFYKNAYVDKNFRPLLYMEAGKLNGLEREFEENIRYIAWIKQFGEGRVFLSAPSHNAQSFESPELLMFYLDGIQYLLGDLVCDDTPVEQNTNE